MAIKDTASRNKPHPFENTPPHAERYQRGDDGWNLKTNVRPVGCPTVASDPNDSHVLQHERTVGFPVTNDRDSPHIFKSTTDGKRKR